jgi:hypothetical protein
LDFLAAERDNDDQDNRGNPPGRGRDLFILSLIRRLIRRTLQAKWRRRRRRRRRSHLRQRS